MLKKWYERSIKSLESSRDRNELVKNYTFKLIKKAIWERMKNHLFEKSLTTDEIAIVKTKWREMLRLVSSIKSSKNHIDVGTPIDVQTVKLEMKPDIKIIYKHREVNGKLDNTFEILLRGIPIAKIQMHTDKKLMRIDGKIEKILNVLADKIDVENIDDGIFIKFLEYCVM